jgi:hypothetical protein
VSGLRVTAFHILSMMHGQNHKNSSVASSWHFISTYYRRCTVKTIKIHLLHLVCILFPHIIDVARSKPHQMRLIFKKVFPKIVPFIRQCEKYGRMRCATDDKERCELRAK